MMRGIKAFILPVLIIMAFFIVACDDDSDKKKDTVLTYAGSEPVGDFVVIQLNKSAQQVRRINYTADPDEDSGWLDYTSVAAADAQGFSIINRVELNGGDYVLFAEFVDTALVYVMFDSSDTPIGWPVYAVFREEVDKSVYSEQAYNWIRMKIDDTPNNSEMEAGFAAFDTFVTGTADVGLLYGAGYNSYNENDSDPLTHPVNGINSSGDSMIASFVANDELIANTMWGSGGEGDMDTAITLTGTASGTNILDFGPGAGGGMGLAIPQSDVTIAQAAGTYFVLCYENNKTHSTDTVQPIKVVISNTSPQIEVFQYQDRTDGTPMLSADLTALEELTGPHSPGGTIPINAQFETAAGNSGADSSAVKNAHQCHGVYIAQDEVDSNYVITVSFDPLGNYFGFTMLDNSGDEIIRFGFGIKDAAYANQ